jgi:phosphate-selective porin OprO/OprP
MEIFTRGLADPDLWTNNVYRIDVGVNWYWSSYLKVCLGCEQADFGTPVQIVRPAQSIASPRSRAIS